MSSSAGGALPPDLMLAHAGSIRALALSILGDEHAAEDVLQETWVRALQKPPPRQDSVGGWLRRVAEGIAISRLRSEGRRRNRETQWVEDRDGAVTNYDATERAEVLRAVVDEVLALDEPYREAVMRRYFEGMPPRKIADATDASVATVNSRLQRAQTKLRERLDRRLSDRKGGMRGALLALVGVPSGAAVVIGAGWLSKAFVSKVAVGVAGAAAVVALAVWIGGGEDARVASEADALAGAVAPASAERELAESRTSDTGRTGAAIAPAAAERQPVGVAIEAPLPGAFSFDLAIEPLDRNGRAVAACNVWLGPEPGPLALVGATPWDGALRLAWRGEEPEAFLVVRAARAGYGSTPLRRIRVRAGTERVVRVALDGSQTLQLEGGVDSNSGLFGSFSPRPRRDEGRFHLDSAGNGVFEDPWLLVGPAVASAAGGFAELAVIEPRTAGTVLADDEERCAVEVRAVDVGGRAVANAYVTISAATGYREDVATGPLGVAQFLAVPPGSLLVTASAPGIAFPVVSRRFDLGPGARRAVDLELVPAPTARIRLVDARGEPRDGWLVELRDDSGSTIARTQLDGEGRATLPVPDGGPVRVLARADATGPGVVVQSALFAGGVEQVMTASFDPHVRTLRILVRGGDATHAVVRVTRIDSGDGLDAAPADPEPGDDGALAYRVRGLGHGWYRVAVGSPTRGWIDAGEHEITSGRGDAVVRATLDDPARLEVENGELVRSRLQGRRAGLRIVSPDVAASDRARMTAAPGAYDLLVERPGHAPTLRQVLLAPGTTMRVE